MNDSIIITDWVFMNKIRRQRLSLFLVGIVGFFGLSYASSVQVMILQNKSFVTEAAIASVMPSISFGSIDSLYNSLMAKLKSKNAQQTAIACRRSSKQDEFSESEETFDDGEQKTSLFSFERLQKMLVLSALLFSAAPSITGDNQQRTRVTCFNLPTIVEDNVCPVVNRCPSDYSLFVGLCTNGWAAAIAHYSATPASALATSCVLSGTCGFVEGISSDENHQSYIRSYSTSFPADAVCIPAGACWQGDPIASAGSVGAAGYYVGRTAGICLKKRYCLETQIEDFADQIEPNSTVVTPRSGVSIVQPGYVALNNTYQESYARSNALKYEQSFFAGQSRQQTALGAYVAIKNGLIK